MCLRTSKSAHILQVGTLLWNPHEKELLGGLGYSKFQLALWRWPTCQLIGEFIGHEQRVLHMTLSPDQCTVCTCALAIIFACACTLSSTLLRACVASALRA